MVRTRKERRLRFGCTQGLLLFLGYYLCGKNVLKKGECGYPKVHMLRKEGATLRTISMDDLPHFGLMYAS